MDFSIYGFNGLKELFNVHPAFVHFPIALLPTALFFYAIGVWAKKPSWLLAGRVCLCLALASVAITVTTGLLGQDNFPHNEQIHHMMETHKHTGYVILGVTAILTAWSFWRTEQRPKGAWAFLLMGLFATYLVLQNGDIGSRMVYLQGAAVKPALPAVTAGAEHQHSEDEGNHANHEHQHE